MPEDEFAPLATCGEALPVAGVVDRIEFHRFVLLQRSVSGRYLNVVYPIDHAMPELVKDTAARSSGWPPDDLVAVRRGVPLIPKWDEPNEECRTKPPIKLSVENVEEFFANPEKFFARLGAEGGLIDKIAITEFNVQALISTGRTLLRNPADGSSLLIEGPSPTISRASSYGELAIRDVPRLLADGGISMDGDFIRFNVANIGELLRQGSTWVRNESGTLSRAIHVTRSYAPQESERFAEGAIDITPLEFTDLPDYSWLGLRDFTFVVYLPYRQEWKLLGFSRGDLLNTIALAPQEETTIDIFSWDRSRQALESSTEFGWESSLEVGNTIRSSRDVTRELTRNNSWKLTSAGVGIGLEKINVNANLGGDFGNSLNAVNRRTTSDISEATTKAATKTRGNRQTRVSETREWGFEERTTRKLRNHNLCRTVVYDVFEVLANYDVTVRPVPEQIRLAVLVPNPMPLRFDRATIMVYEGVLQRALLDPEQRAGFAAARWLAARDEYSALAREASRAHDLKVGVGGAGTAVRGAVGAGTVPRQSAAREVGGAETSRVVAAGDQIAGAVAKIQAARPRAREADAAGVRGAALELLILEYRQWLFRVIGLEKLQPGFWGACVRFQSDWPNDKRPERVEQLLSETAAAWVEAAIRGTIATLLWVVALPTVAREVLSRLGVVPAFWYTVEKGYTFRGFDDAGLGAILQTARTEVGTWRQALAVSAEPSAAPTGSQSSAPPATAPADAAAATSATEGATPPFSDEITAEHRVAERALVAHLEQHRSHYMEAMWGAIGPADQARILETSFANLGDDVEPQVLGFVGDRLAVPFRVDRYPQLRRALDQAISAIKANPEPAPVRVVLPTPGVHMEARLGACDACEPYVDAVRAHELAERQAKVEKARADARLAALEADRIQARLKAKPPQLDDPNPDSALTVRLLTEKPDI